MSEQYKEPETMKITPPKEESAPESIVVDVAPDSKPHLVESSDKSANLPAPLNRDPFVGTVLNNRYRVISLIGKGATSTVYKAEDTNLNQAVAIKMLHGHLAVDAAIMRRFEQEAKTARLLRHPNIVDVREYEKTDTGIPYLVMDLVEGTSLQDALKAAGWIPVERAIEIFIQVCAALAAAHEKGIVHRDLKPSNIMLTNTADGNLLVKVLDFGVAKILPATGDTVLKLTQTGETLGSILYMSPEQCLDKELDGRSDCYSLGCVMYETLTGKPPLSARTAFETMNRHISEMPERLDRVRPDLKWAPGLQYIVFRAMAKDPNQRYQKITELQDDLRKLPPRPDMPFVQPKDNLSLADSESLPKEIANSTRLKRVRINALLMSAYFVIFFLIALTTGFSMFVAWCTFGVSTLFIILLVKVLRDLVRHSSVQGSKPEIGSETEALLSGAALERIRDDGAEASGLIDRGRVIVFAQILAIVLVVGLCIFYQSLINFGLGLVLIMAVIAGGFYLFDRTVQKREEIVQRARSQIEKAERIKASIIRIDPHKFDDSDLYPKFWVDIEPKNPEYEMMRLQIAPMVLGDPLWDRFPKAKRRSRRKDQELLPLPVEVYLAPNKQPIALTVHGVFAWVLDE